VTRYAVRISRFEDQMAFRRVLDLLGRLYPDRPTADFEAALAKLPCLLSHDAHESVAQGLRQALEARGARVRLLPVDAVKETPKAISKTQSLSPEIDLEFLRKNGAPRVKTGGVTLRPSPAAASARAVPTPESAELSGEWSREKAPWEE